jgi:hypothetical protein
VPLAARGVQEGHHNPQLHTKKMRHLHGTRVVHSGVPRGRRLGHTLRMNWPRILPCLYASVLLACSNQAPSPELPLADLGPRELALLFVEKDRETNIAGTWELQDPQDGRRVLVSFWPSNWMFVTQGDEVIRMRYLVDQSRLPMLLNVYPERGGSAIRLGLIEVAGDSMHVALGTSARPADLGSAALYVRVSDL